MDTKDLALRVARLERANLMLKLWALLPTVGCLLALLTSMFRQEPQGKSLQLDSLTVKSLRAGVIEVEADDSFKVGKLRLEPSAAYFLGRHDDTNMVVVNGYGVRLMSDGLTCTLSQTPGGTGGGLLVQKGVVKSSGVPVLPNLFELGTDGSGSWLRIWDGTETPGCVLGAQDLDGPDGKPVHQPVGTLCLRSANGKVRLLQPPK